MHTSQRNVRGVSKVEHLLFSNAPPFCRFVEFTNKRAMYDALERMQGKKLNGRRIKLTIERV